MSYIKKQRKHCRQGFMKLQFITFNMMLLLIFASVKSFTYAQETDQSIPKETESLSETEKSSDMETEFMDISLIGQNLLVIDNENKYEGMDRAYKNGYTPCVENGTATIVLPLYAVNGAEINSITVTPSMGYTENSPFIAKNYQKSIYKTMENINEGQDFKEVFLIKFEFELSLNRMNGVYPVELNVDYVYAGTLMNQKFVSYITITDGKEVNSDADTEEKPSSQPKVIVSQCMNMPERIKSGDVIEFSVLLKNTSRQKMFKT